MKKRVLRELDNGVYKILLFTEDWSEGDRNLMISFGEPEINMGGDVQYIFGGETKTKTFGDQFVRLLRGFPHLRKFDSRDYGSVDEAIAVAVAWKELILTRIDAAITELRGKGQPLPTEEVSEI